jgi:hypothetical protein
MSGSLQSYEQVKEGHDDIVKYLGQEAASHSKEPWLMVGNSAWEDTHLEPED